MVFNLFSFDPLPKKIVQILIWRYHPISEHLGYTLLLGLNKSKLIVHMAFPKFRDLRHLLKSQALSQACRPTPTQVNKNYIGIVGSD